MAGGADRDVTVRVGGLGSPDLALGDGHDVVGLSGRPGAAGVLQLALVGVALQHFLAGLARVARRTLAVGAHGQRSLGGTCSSASARSTVAPAVVGATMPNGLILRSTLRGSR